jgi:hypothetical protein
MSHADRPTFSALLGNRSSAGITAEGMTVSFANRPRCFGKNRGSNGCSEAWQGKEEINIARFTGVAGHVFGQLLQKARHSAFYVSDLPVKQNNSGQ